jgi:15-cis-phytoene synthase
MAPPASAAAVERSEIDRAARELAYDDYLAALLAPPRYRGDLITLAAVFGELARIPLQVSDATLGEIRLQWWHDALASDARSGHPVADAALALNPRLPKPLAELIAPVIEARAAELYAEPFPTGEAFGAYLTAPETAAFAIRAALLGVQPDQSDAPLDAGARTLGLVRTCVRLPYLFAKGRYPVDAQRLGITGDAEVVDERQLRVAMSDLISEAATGGRALRPSLRRISPDLRRVMVPVALAGPYLRAIQQPGRDVLRDVADPSPLERSTRLWLAARLGRF